MNFVPFEQREGQIEESHAALKEKRATTAKEGGMRTKNTSEKTLKRPVTSQAYLNSKQRPDSESKATAAGGAAASRGSYGYLLNNDDKKRRQQEIAAQFKKYGLNE